MFFTKTDQFIKIQLGNLTPECKDLFKDFLLPSKKKQPDFTSKLKQHNYLF